ncbi:MAG: hypothetical protein JW920_11600 [Deltaproteobacteria bacterium]|nr:hypothetical protein [Deltaproteobacteria bacterium]
MEKWNVIEDQDKATLSFFYDATRCDKPCWCSFIPLNYGDFWLTQLVNMIFLAPRHTLEALNFEILPVDTERWKNNLLLSSGVGQQLSQRLRKLVLKMYHLDRNLADHVTHASQMNYEAIKTTPLT